MNEESAGHRIVVINPNSSDLKKKQPDAYKVFYEHGRAPARVIGDLASSWGGLFLRLLRMVSIPLIIT